MDTPVFRPQGATVNLAVTTTTGSVALTASANSSKEVRLYNRGTVEVFVTFGASTVTATTTTSMPLAPGAAEVFGVASDETHVAAITASGTATLYATTGRGA
jgi:Na+/serine symporter